MKLRNVNERGRHCERMDNGTWDQGSKMKGFGPMELDEVERDRGLNGEDLFERLVLEDAD